MTENTSAPVKFEHALARLQEIVQVLEKDQLGLEASIDLYEEGVKLSSVCEDLLSKARLRIEKVDGKPAN
jgi:exodeoxyribonuclease VII small subunit